MVALIEQSVVGELKRELKREQGSLKCLLEKCDKTTTNVAEEQLSGLGAVTADILQEHYGVQLPWIMDEKQHSDQTSDCKTLRGKTINSCKKGEQHRLLFVVEKWDKALVLHKKGECDFTMQLLYMYAVTTVVPYERHEAYLQRDDWKESPPRNHLQVRGPCPTVYWLENVATSQHMKRRECMPGEPACPS